MELGKFTSFPDLILMDGGKGQVNVALQVLDELHLEDSGMRYGKRRPSPYPRDYTIRMRRYRLNRSSEAFRLITRIQDEAHRFAIEYHRQLRGKGSGAFHSG